MAPLYKRYIPAKSSTEKPVESAARIQNVEADAATPTPEKKRKRERTKEEVVERKAKKLKKRGVDPAIAADGDTTLDTVDVDASLAGPEVEHHDNGAEAPQPQSEFAYVTSAKKRHKLEKEARKARKAAKKDIPPDEGQFAGSHASVQPERDDHGNATGAGPNGVEMGIEDANANAEAAKDRTDSRSEKKRKKRRKENESPEEELAQGVEDMDTSVADIDTTSKTGQSHEEHAQPNKRRDILEGVIEELKSDAAKAEDEKHLRKHTAVLGKFQKSARRGVLQSEEEPAAELPKQPIVSHLELPEPERTPTPEFESEDAALPPWLAKPIMVAAGKKATFKDLDTEADTAERLSKLGFVEALPVQQALVPLMMPPGMSGAAFPPGTEDVLPDVAVSAPTGSGKTIAYLLPILEGLRHRMQHGKLSALVVVPTRELVMQVAAVAESLAKGSSIKVGMATGTGKFKDEQDKIIRRGARYDPSKYTRLVEFAKNRIFPPDEGSDDFQSYLEQAGEEDTKQQQWLEEAVAGLVNHVPTYNSAIDILVATPGRLLEHINNTLGFNLVHLQWLVIDEADKLLDNQYEGFLGSLNVELTRERTEEEQDAREKYLRSQGTWDERKERRLRKAILSATMTRDISKLTSLNLQRPKMIVVRGSDNTDFQTDAHVDDANGESSVKESADGFELPRSLVEYCVPVGDGSEKPLVAVELLKSKILGDKHVAIGKDSEKIEVEEDENSDDSSSSSDSDSDDSSNLSSDSDSSSSASDSEDDSNDDDDAERKDSPIADPSLPVRSSMNAAKPSSALHSRAPTVLIFTSSNEAANRLSHLLQGIHPAWKSWITTLVKAGKARIRSKADEPAIVISTDRAARGLDAFSNRPITHVIQYDVPRSLTSYIHRVGRTARAGRDGDAWTLYTHAEARWFVNEITKANNVSRRLPVERVKVFMADDGTRDRYQKVLAGMRDEVFGPET